MDPDLRLLGALLRSPLASQAELAAELGVSATAVRNRMKRLEVDGVIRGWIATPAPQTYGRVQWAYSWDEAQHPLDELLGVPNTVWAASSVLGGSGMMAHLREDQIAAWEAEVERRFGPPADVAQVIEPVEPIVLGPLEWRTLAALVRAPRASLSELAGLAGLSPRVVRARREQLVACGAVRVEPLLRPSRSGALFFHVFVTMVEPGDQETRASVRDLLADRAIPVVDYGVGPYLFARATNVIEQARMLRDLEQMPCVASVRSILNEDFAQADGRILGWIDEALAAWPGRRTATT